MSTTSDRRHSWGAALALGALLGTAALMPLHALAADQKQQKISADLGKPLQAAQQALQAKNYTEALAKVKEADGYAKKNPFDQHVIDEFSGYGYAGTQQWAEAAKHFEATLGDGFLKDSEIQPRLQVTTQCYYNAGIQATGADKTQYLDKAIQFGTRAIQGGAGPDYTSMVVNASYIKEDYKTVKQLQQQLVDSMIQKGQSPTADQLEMLRSAYVKLNDNDGLFNAFKTTLTYHPTAAMWDEVLSMIASNASKTSSGELQLYRLMLEANVLKRSSDYTRMAELAQNQGSPGEAKTVLDKGFAENAFTDQVKEENKKALASAKVKSAADQASLPTLTKEVEAAPTGQKLYALGYAYFGYQQYDKAAEMLGKAVAQGGLKNEAETRLLLGIAQLKAGHQDEAFKTFKQVSSDPALGQIAQLWPLTVNKTGT
jgi:tetratricopeptide (TPR) repeat protein